MKIDNNKYNTLVNELLTRDSVTSEQLGAFLKVFKNKVKSDINSFQNERKTK